jgi:nucleotide-binding universal stress UspA family protein
MSGDDVTMASESPTSGPASPADRGSIVVGHDGSDGADRALAEGLLLARELDTPLVVVRTWSLATAPRPAHWAFGYVPSFEEYAEAVRAALLDDTRSRVEDVPEVSVVYRVVHGPAAKHLVEISQQARMLVVGARGLGGLAGMLLGSVSEQCVRHAACPVLVTRAEG